MMFQCSHYRYQKKLTWFYIKMYIYHVVFMSVVCLRWLIEGLIIQSFKYKRKFYKRKNHFLLHTYLGSSNWNKVSALFFVLFFSLLILLFLRFTCNTFCSYFLPSFNSSHILSTPCSFSLKSKNQTEPSHTPQNPHIQKKKSWRARELS